MNSGTPHPQDFSRPDHPPVGASPIASDHTAEVGEVVSLPDMEALARERMPRMAYEYIASGAADEITLRWNRQAFDRIRLRPRVLQDVSTPDTRVALFGRTLPSPVLLAPTAYHRAVHPEGELETARGAGAAGAAWVVSSNTNTAIEEIAKVATAPLWFQLYVQSDRGFTRELVQRVEAAGCEALCVTVDTPVLGARNRQQKARFELPAGVSTPHLYDVNSGRRTIMTPERVVLTWKDIEWLRSICGVPLLLKGILTAEDAATAIDAGVSGIIVSNHGARNLDTVPATIEVLPEIADQVGGQLPVLVDGGIRRGTDVLKALALGAQAVLIGRPYLYGLAVGGAEGVQRVVELLNHEFQMALSLMGRPSIESVDRSVLWPLRSDGT